MTGGATPPRDRRSEGKPSPEELEAELDESIEESFPASDPPAWVNEARLGMPRRDKAEEDGPPDRDAGPSGRSKT
jgi:hypothetical protein